MKHGVLLCDKPQGLSSHDVVSRARRALATRRIGHAGTLDPMATGVLVLAIGEATKVLRYLVLDDKRYEATLRLGTETDTLDAEGKVVGACQVPALALAQVQSAASAFVGDIVQRAPDVSAIKQGGVALHARVRRGESVQAPERDVRVYAIEIRAVRAAEIDLSVHSGKGFYVRALARDLSRALGTCGHLSALRRLQSGQFSVAQAIAFERVQAAAQGDLDSKLAVERAIVPVREALAFAPALELDAPGLAHAAHGRAIPVSHVVSGELPSGDTEPVMLCDATGVPVAVARIRGAQLEVVRGLRLAP